MSSSYRCWPASSVLSRQRDHRLLRIFYIGRPAGWEHYELKPTATGLTLTSDYDYVDRGRRNHTQLILTDGQ